jgi:hypothetical protein
MNPRFCRDEAENKSNPKSNAEKFVRSQSGHAARSDPATPCANLQQPSPKVSQIRR